MNNSERNNKLNKKKSFILSFIGTIIYFMAIMTPFGIGQYSVYITSYFHYFNQNINIQLGNLMMPILILFLSLSAPIGGILEHKLGMHLTLIINSLILEFLVFIFIYQRNIWITFLLIILIGMTIGSVITIPGKNICFYYPEKKGIITSLMTSCNVIIGSMLNVFGEKIINPNRIILKENETYYPINVAQNYIKFYKIALIIIPVCSFLSLPFLKKYKEQNDNKEGNLDKRLNGDDINEKENYSKNLKAAIFNSRIWKIAMISIFSQFAIGFALSTFRVYGALISINGTIMQYAPLFFGFSMIIFGPIWGFINDKFQSFKIIRFICLLFIIISTLLSIFIKSNIFYIICIFIGSIFNTGMNTLMNPYIMKIYGMKYFIEIGGVITICMGIINIFKGGISFLLSFYFQTGKELQTPYRIIFLIGTGLNILAYILSLKEKDEVFIYPYNPKKENKIELSTYLESKTDANSSEINEDKNKNQNNEK